MKLWGQISVELSVGDYLEAADHQRRLEDILQLVRTAYPEATLAALKGARRPLCAPFRPIGTMG